MNEKKTIHRWWWAWNFDKEEQWLNEMAMEGWALYDAGFCVYRFEKTEPGEYIIRLEMHKPDTAYMEFMKETGAESVGRCAQWAYFRRKEGQGSFNIFSDIDSRISHLNKIISLFLLAALANILIGISNISVGMINHTINNSLGIINLFVAYPCLYGIGRIQGKKEFLKKERFLHE